jgi:hypothetical protein
MLRRQVLRWCEDNLKTLSTADPAVPDTLNDRAADHWRPLLAAADRAGSDRPKRARDAALVLSGDSVEGGSIRAQLLADIRLLLNDETIKGLTSEAIIAELVSKPDRPWADWKNGKAITPKALAGLLKPFGIFPHQLSVGEGKELRGYARHVLENAFSCYLPPLQCVDVSETPQPQAQVPLFNVSANPLTDTLRKREKCLGQWRGRPNGPENRKRKLTAKRGNPPAPGNSLDDFK